MIFKKDLLVPTSTVRRLSETFSQLLLSPSSLFSSEIKTYDNQKNSICQEKFQACPDTIHGAGSVWNVFLDVSLDTDT